MSLTMPRSCLSCNLVIFLVGPAWYDQVVRDLLGTVVQPLDLHLVNVGSIPTGPTHGEVRLQPHPGDVRKSTPNVRKGPRSGLNLEGRLSEPHVLCESGMNIEKPYCEICDWNVENPVVNIVFCFDRHHKPSIFIHSISSTSISTSS